MHWPVQHLALSLQVALDTAIQGLRPRWRFELPLFSHPSALLALDRRVTPQSRSSLSVSQCVCRLPRTPHSRVLPAFDLQVALNLESIRHYRRFSNYGFPRNSISPVSPLDASSRGAPDFASSGPAGDRSSSFPDSRILQRLRCVSLGFPRCLALPVAPADTGSRSPRFLHLPALPATDFRVTPNLSFFSASGCLSSRFPSNSALSAAPADDAVGFPTSLIFRLGLGFDTPGFPGLSLPRRRLMDYRVSSALAPSGSAVPASSGLPESCIYGWVDDVSRSSRTLHPRRQPRMNLRI